MNPLAQATQRPAPRSLSAEELPERVFGWVYVLNRFAVSCLALGTLYIIYAIAEELTK